MERRINWLHITDLHYGQKGQNLLLPKIKKELFTDIEFIKDEIGKIDIVFFTGDLTQSGKKEEFDELTVFLKDLWSHFKKLSSEPYLIAIPGNHDLNRPESTRATVKVLKNYHLDHDFQDIFWNGLVEKSEYHELISKCFFNFSEWYNNVQLPKPDLKQGLLPGDISTQLLINNVSLNLIGLNTAFLELSDGDYVGKLAIHPSQLSALTGNDFLNWIGNSDMSVLLTHHGPRWYDKTSLAYYNNDINPANTFYSHLCGHLHEANTHQYGIVGSGLRKTQLAPSLFGLQKINNQVDRIHGYYAGSYIIQGDTMCELFYPRKANRKYDDSYGIDADTGYHLGKKGYLELKSSIIKSVETKELERIPSFNVTESEIKENDIPVAEDNILDFKPNSNNAKELDQVPRTSYSILFQHAGIRIFEQNKFVELIKKNGFAWLITDWGLNENGFIGSTIGYLNLEQTKNNFILNCEDISNDKELVTAFGEQFGMTLQRFCIISAALENTLLVLDHINLSLYITSNAYGRFLEIVNSIHDYCPNMYIILITRQPPAFLKPEYYTRLTPLDPIQIKSYINAHPGNTQELDDPENLLKLAEITSGLPKHIDKVIEGLTIATFEELVEAEREMPQGSINDDQIPKSLKQTISLFTETQDRFKLRSLKLLKILTILANGETFSNLTRLDGREPIYLDNANELERMSLLEVITTSKVMTKEAGGPIQQIKILRVPRQIRDYINSFITENEKDDIVKLACDMYFGNKWREGNIKGIYGTSVLNAHKFFNVDNCHLAIKHIMANAFRAESETAIERTALIAINFCDHVYEVGDYKNAISTAEDIYNWIKSTDLNRSKATIAKILGESLRMIGSHDKSTYMLNEALNIEGGILSNHEKNEVYIDLGYTYIMQSKFEKAIESAKAVEKTATPKGVQSIQAKYILAQSMLAGDELIKRLKVLESEARRADAQSLVNTLSLRIAELNIDISDRKKRLTKVLDGKGDDYNKIRAIIKKSTDTLSYANESLSDEELHLLNISYSYLYTQRIDVLFTKCHNVLWLYCTKEQRPQDLLNLFKHSSLVWRISGQIELEKTYFDKLECALEQSIGDVRSDSVTDVNLDYYNRRKLEYGTQRLLT